MLSFPAVVKSFSNIKAHHDPDRSTAHRRSKEGKINRCWKTRGLDEVGPTKARAKMGRTVEEGLV